MIWYMWRLAALSAVALFVIAIGHTFNHKRDFHIPAETVRETEDARTSLLAGQA